jgi:phage terminase large subunit-like protein
MGVTVTNAARPWIGLVFKCLAGIAVIFAFVFFMQMDEERSLVDRYRTEGTVSRAVVTEKSLDQVVYSGRKGRTRTEDIQVLSVRFNPKSQLMYADFAAASGAAEPPGPPPLSGDLAKDSEFGEVIWVTREVYDRTSVGDSFVVVDTPYSSDGPELIEDIRDFDPSAAYPKIALALVLAVLLALVGWLGPWRRRA